jgi:hypothetical protein
VIVVASLLTLILRYEKRLRKSKSFLSKGQIERKRKRVIEE